MAQRTIFSNLEAALGYYFNPNPVPDAARSVYHDIRNNVGFTFSSADGSTSVSALAVDTDNRIHVDRGNLLGARGSASFYLKANASLATQTMFIADRPMVITAIEYSHSTLGTDASAVTCAVFKDTGTQIPGGGATTMVGTFNCKATINTVQQATLLAVSTSTGNVDPGITLAAGDRLSVVFSGVLTALAGVVITVFYSPGFKEVPAVYAMNANSTIATQSFFLANRDLLVTGVSMVWSAAGTDAGAVTLDVTHETTTAAPGAGTSILTAAQSVKGTANTVVNPALTATAAQLKLIAGDRLSVKLTGTPTALAGVVVMVYFQAVGSNATGYVGQVEAPFTFNSNTGLGTMEFFIADRDYEVVDASLTWGTAGTDGGAVTADFQIDKGTAVPGSGTSVTTGAVSVKTTANTTAVLPINVSRRQRLLSQGDRLSFVTAGVLTSLAGVSGTVSLLPR